MRLQFPVLLFAIAAIFAASAALAAAEVEAEAKRLEGLLMAPCCGANTLDQHESAAAWEMKREIRTLLASGMSAQEVLDHYVAEHGPLILAVPPARGFNLVAYGLPMLGLVVGPLLLWGWLRHRSRRSALESAADPLSTSPIDSGDEERLERELRAL